MRRFDVLFSGDTASDVESVYCFIEGFSRQIGEPIFDVSGVPGIVHACTSRFPWKQGHEKASPFKKAAAFTTYFCAEKPIANPLPESFGELRGETNAIVAYAFCVSALHNATIYPDGSDPIVLEKRIIISQHYWQDLIVALAKSTPVYHCDHVALIYESLAYQAGNFHYDPVI